MTLRTEDELSKLVSSREGENLFYRQKLILEFTELVADLLGKQGISQSELARRLGVSRPVVCRLLGGENATLGRVADVLLALGYEVKMQAVPRSSA